MTDGLHEVPFLGLDHCDWDGEAAFVSCELSALTPLALVVQAVLANVPSSALEAKGKNLTRRTLCVCSVSAWT